MLPKNESESLIESWWWGTILLQRNFEENELECERMVRKINQSGANTLVLGLVFSCSGESGFTNINRVCPIPSKLYLRWVMVLPIEAGLEPKAPEFDE